MAGVRYTQAEFDAIVQRHRNGVECSPEEVEREQELAAAFLTTSYTAAHDLGLGPVIAAAAEHA